MGGPWYITIYTQMVGIVLCMQAVLPVLTSKNIYGPTKWIEFKQMVGKDCRVCTTDSTIMFVSRQYYTICTC